MAYVFGGVYDEVDEEEDLQGVFYNDLFSLNLNDARWRSVELSNGKCN